MEFFSSNHIQFQYFVSFSDSTFFNEAISGAAQDLQTDYKQTSRDYDDGEEWMEDSHEVRGEEHSHENGESQATDLCFLFIKNHVGDSVNFGDKSWNMAMPRWVVC